jgi:hypothetical protein
MIPETDMTRLTNKGLVPSRGTAGSFRVELVRGRTTATI